MAKPTIFVFCNSCAPQWHSIVALAEDGVCLTGHLCSDHGYIGHDMGFTGNWKHDKYNEHYPDGWTLEYVEGEDVAAHERVQQAIKLNQERQGAGSAKSER